MRLAPPLLALLLLAGCDLLDRPPLERTYGAPYDFFVETAPGPNGEGSPAPFLSEDGVLHVTVRYTGGCAEHTFRLETELTDAVATVWLVHEDDGDTCEALLMNHLRIRLSNAVLARPRIVLAAPAGEGIVLRDLASGASP